MCTVFFVRVELVEEYSSGPEGAPPPATGPTRQLQAFLSFNILFYGAVSLVYGRLVEAADAPGGSNSVVLVHIVSNRHPCCRGDEAVAAALSKSVRLL